MPRLDIKRQQELEPKRMQHAVQTLSANGMKIINKDNTKVQFMFAGKLVTFFPYSGWFSGKSIVDGRGIEKLIKQLKSK